MKEFNYYKSQLNQLDINAPTVNIKLTDYHGNATKNMGINSLESIDALRVFLDEREEVLKAIGIKE